MFTQKKKNYRAFIYTAIIITLCLLIIAIAWPTAPSEENDAYGAEQKVSAGLSADTDAASVKKIEDDENANSTGDNGNDENRGSNSAYGSDDSDFDDEDEYYDGEDNFPPGENSDITGESQSYYLVKKAGESIKVFFVDHSGNEVELETTRILYEMLSYEDQALFDRGYKVSSQEELAVLLQDFES